MFKNIIPRKGVQASPDLQGGSCAKRFRTPWQPQDPELSSVTCVCRWPWELHLHPHNAGTSGVYTSNVGDNPDSGVRNWKKPPHGSWKHLLQCQ